MIDRPENQSCNDDEPKVPFAVMQKAIFAYHMKTSRVLRLGQLVYNEFCTSVFART